MCGINANEETKNMIVAGNHPTLLRLLDKIMAKESEFPEVTDTVSIKEKTSKII